MTEKNKRAEDARARIEDFRARMLEKHGEGRVKFVFRVLPAIILSIILLIALFFLIPIREIEVRGEVEMFNEGDIIEASESAEGKSLFLRSSGAIERTIRKNLPLTESVKVKKSLFGKVTIDIQFSDVDFYCKIGDKYYIKGQNFTEYSKISLDGEVLKTVYLGPTILALNEEVDPARASEMKVSQVEKNKEILSTTE
jgi:hypothetical protein